jgi:outer membrane lipoprotein-sorting protein
LLLLLQSAPAQEPDAEKLFKKMEERLVAAKTLQFTVKLTSDRSPLDAMEMTLLMGEGNKLRIDYRMHKGEPGDQCLIVSDGKEMKQKRLDESWGPWKSPADQNTVNKIGTARAGGGFFLMYYRMNTREEATKSLPISGFKSGGREKIDGIETEIVEYTVEVPDRGPIEVKVWIDPARLVPLRRTLAGDFQGKKVTATSVYGGFKIDEPIDDAKFKLP